MLDDTVPAERSITVEDLLTFRLGFGAIMAPPGAYPVQDAEAELGLMTLGPPWPPPFGSDEWIRRFATLPLLEQPGAAWRYNTGAHVLGVLLERASGQTLEAFLRARLFESLGMVDTSFSVPTEKQGRFTTAYRPDPATGALEVLDPPVGGWWSEPPAMATAAGMLVSTIDDLWTFVSMLLSEGRHDGEQLLSPASVADMTRSPDGGPAGLGHPVPRRPRVGLRHGDPGAAAGRAPDSVGFRMERRNGHRVVERSGKARGLTGILLTTRAMTSPEPPPHFVDFWDAAYGALGD